MKSRASINVHEMVLAGVFASITAVLSQVAIPLPFSPVPISMGILAVYSAAILLSRRAAVLSQVIYLFLGAIGVPVFGNFRGGLSVIVGPTGGYLLAYPIVAFVISYFIDKITDKENENTNYIVRQIKRLFIISFAHSLLYAMGTLWLSILLKISFQEALIIGVVPFIVLDFVKIIFTIFAIFTLKERLKKLGLLSSS
jgi:biotin transport system substrate-specific component